MRKLGRFARAGNMGEFRTRAAQEIAKRLDFARHLLGRPFESQERIGTSPSDKEAFFFFSPDDVPRITAALRQHMPAECSRIVSDAERICRKEFALLGFQKLNFGSRINWHLDPVHEKCAPRRIWYKIPCLDVAQVGDPKIIWELNRHQHLVTLAKTYCLTREDRFVQEIFGQWADWQRENPYPLGINWASSLEVGFRSLSWLWVWHLLNGSGADVAKFREPLWRSLSVHGRHIEMYLSTYSSPNTHLLGEAVAMFFLGVLCPELPRAGIWKDKGWRIIKEESRRQVLPDGMHFEQATYYHVYALDFFLHARVLASRNAVPVPAEFDDTLKRMLEWLSSVAQNAVVPRFGDDDGGRVFDARRNRGEHLLDPLSTGAVLFGHSDWKAVAGRLREETLWLLGPTTSGEYEKLQDKPAPLRSVFHADSGTYIMSEGGEVRAQLTIDAGKQGVFTSGHGHADALSVHFSMKGREWLADPGTFSYLAGSEGRDAFRGTSAHNTLQVDSQSQAIPRTSFAWESLPKVEVQSWINTEEFQFFEACHTGYRRFPQPVLHRRIVFHLVPGLWFFLDLAEGQGTHQLDLSWHFAPGISLKNRDVNACAFSDGGSSQLALFSDGAAHKSSLDWGWYSPVYGERVPALVLRQSHAVALPHAFATLILSSSANDAKFGQFGEIDTEETSCVRGYSYTTGDGIHQWWVSTAREPWRAEALESDAHFLYCNFTPDGQMDRFVLCDGTFLRFSEKTLVEAREKMPSY